MIRGIGMLAGQVGDAAVCTVAVRAFKEVYPESEFTFAVAEKYRDVLPLFLHHPLITDLHVWRGYDDPHWPTQEDAEYIRWRGYDWVANAMADHREPDWYNRRGYGAEACVCQFLPVPDDLSYELVPWMRLRKDCRKVVTLSLFPSKGSQPDKGLHFAEAEKLCLALKAKGYTPVQLGGRFEPRLENAVAPSMSILEATTLMLSSALHITADTGFASIAAGYKHRVLGFFGRNYADLIDNRTQIPPNVNAHYLRDFVVPQNECTAEMLVGAIEREGLLKT